MSYEAIEYRPGRVARVILSRPERRNAQNGVMLRELHECFMQASADPEVRVIVLSGAGQDFSSGHDIKDPTLIFGEQYQLHRDDPDVVWRNYERMRVTYVENHLAWRDIPKPTIAMVHGRCLWGGWMLASAMDLAFASSDALFLPAAPSDYWSVTWELGARKTKEVLFEDRVMTAQEAHEDGWVSRVYAPEDLERETLAYAERVAKHDPFRLRDIKAVVNETLDDMGFSRSVKTAFGRGLRPLERKSSEADFERGATTRSAVQDALTRHQEGNLQQ